MVIHGYPATEGNAIEVVKKFAARYNGKVYWLIDDNPSSFQPDTVLESELLQRVTTLSHRSFRAVVAYLTAECIMYTHGLFGDPITGNQHKVVNLWHGGGAKASLMATPQGKPKFRSDFLVASSKQLGTIRARESMLSEDQLLLTGNPRVDQYSMAPAASKLVKLGIRPDKPFVLWLPTYRHRAASRFEREYVDTTTSGFDRLLRSVCNCAAVFRDSDIQLILKPHPAEADSYRRTEAHVITNGDLVEAGIQLYSLIGASSALITDYSSVWIDYISLDRPIAFVMPDEAEYKALRGLQPPDFLDWLPGRRLSEREDFTWFANEVKHPSSVQQRRRQEVIDHMGIPTEPDVANRLFDELVSRGVVEER